MKLLCVLLVAMLLAQQVAPAYTFVLAQNMNRIENNLNVAKVAIGVAASVLSLSAFHFLPTDEPRPPPEVAEQTIVPTLADNGSKTSRMQPTSTPAPVIQQRGLVPVAKKGLDTINKYREEEAHRRQTIKEAQKQARFERALAHIQLHGIDLAPRQGPVALYLVQAIRVANEFLITAHNRQVVPFEDHLARFRVQHPEAAAAAVPVFPFVPSFSISRSGGELIPHVDHLARFRNLPVASSEISYDNGVCPLPYNLTITQTGRQVAAINGTVLSVASSANNKPLTISDFAVLGWLALLFISYHVKKAVETWMASPIEQAKKEKRKRSRRTRKCE